VSAGGAPSIAQVNAPVGTYGVHVIGALSAGQFFGTAGVQLTNASGMLVNGFVGPGGTMVSGFTTTLSLPPAVVPPNARVIDSMIAISTAGTYQLDLKDLLFPAALGVLQVSLADPTGNLVSGFPVSAAGGMQSVTFTATATGNYHLVGAAQAASGAAGGLYNIHIFSTSAQTDALNESDSLGQVASLGATNLAAGTYQLALTDFAFPKSLAQVVAAAVQGQSVAASTAAASPASFTAVAGNCQLFALAVPDMTAGSGAYGVTLTPQGGGTVFSAVQTTSNGTGVTAYTFPVAIASGGSYTLTLADFQFPLSFATLEVAAAQNGALLGTLTATAAAPLKISPSAGPMFILAAATPGTGGKGIFGVDLTPSAGGTPVLDRTQGVGGAFGTTTVPITTAGSYNVTLSDLAFPGNFNELAAVVTQGPTRLGSIYGGGMFPFTATPGSYVINVLGTPQPIVANSTQTAGTYGVSVAPTPPAPTVTLTSSATQVNSGDTVTLTWSSQNAKSCTATGAWSMPGALGTFGTQVSAALVSLTTFTVTCTGDGGSTSQSVMVSVTPPSPPSSKGGGSLDGLMLLLLALGAAGKALAARSRVIVDR
jgi:hypothetical protein